MSASSPPTRGQLPVSSALQGATTNALAHNPFTPEARGAAPTTRPVRLREHTG